ncbi:hypothetical protein 2 [Beihai picorna-like virus 63]|uniref:hypothetical protein 2 n=1 Tax=Beihai picorna-like virus 63 TaxID=1922609 RepID=UPI00090ACB24|nr:hypothetical protein 2 [Beihai picorna-like virus 63]APG76889.1 hypothetical protein 2 [Beihai picorna-like virus 63]
MELNELLSRSDLLSFKKTRKIVMPIIKRKRKEEQKIKTQALLEARKKKKERLKIRNDNFVVSESNPAKSVSTNDKITFFGNSSSDIPNNSDDMVTTSIAEFLKRPVLIDDFTLALGTTVVRSINPWDLWSLNPSVRSKLSHYAYFSGTMCIRMTLASSKYYFGSLMLSYQPYADSNRVLEALESRIGDSTDFKCIFNYLSQSPERCNIRVGVDNSVEMRLPMFIPKEKIRLFNSDGALMTNSTSYEELEPLGRLYYSTINSVLSATSDATSAVKLQTYAWIEDLKLSGLTATDIDITAESEAKPAFDVKATEIVNKASDVRDKINNHPVVKALGESAGQYADDEYNPKNGPISTMASAVSNIAEKFTDIPILGEGARATAFVSGKAAQLLKFFGFSKPVLISDPTFAKSVVTDNMAHASGSSTSYKLTLDPKQELSVQAIGGDSDVDPMALKFVTRKESYFTTFRWSNNKVPRSDTIFAAPVCPNINTVNTTNSTLVQPTALSFASSFFAHWRGTISFRFEVIASSFHRGKLMFIYEPNGAGFDLIESNPTDMNQQCIFYLDIEEGKDLTVDCKYLSDRLFSNTALGPDMEFEQIYSIPDFSGSDLTVHKQLFNGNVSIGNLYVRPFTTLVGPTNAPFIDINVYVYSDDMELARPINIGTRDKFVTSESQPRLEAAGGGIQKDIEGTTRTSDTYSQINNVISDNNNIYQYHFGEKVESFRTLLKRGVTTLHGSLDNTSSTNQYPFIVLPLYPVVPRNTLPKYGATSIAADAAFYSPLTNEDGTTRSLFSELALSYLFVKGGYRHRVAISLDPDENHKDLTYYVSMWNSINETTSFDNYEWDQGTTNVDVYHTNNLSSSIFHSGNTGIVDVEVPYLSTNTYELSCRRAVEATNSTATLFKNDPSNFIISLDQLDCTTESGFVRKFVDYTSAAEDFTFFRFQGAAFVIQS